MNNIERKKVLEVFANADLRSARKHGKVAICNTLKGTLEVSYDYENKTYTIQAYHCGVVLSNGKAKAAKEILVSNYSVTEAD